MIAKKRFPLHKRAHPYFLLILGLLFGLGVAIDWDVSFKDNLSSSNLWDALSAIGTITAAITGVFIANRGWKKAEKIHKEQIEENRRLKNEENAKKEYLNSQVAYYHFYSIASLAALLDCNNDIVDNMDEQRRKINEISDLWRKAIESEALSNTILFIGNWKNRNLLDDMIIYLNTSQALVLNDSSKKVNKAAHKHLWLITDLFKELSLLHCQTKSHLLNNQYNLTPEQIKENEELKLKLETSEDVAEKAYSLILPYNNKYTEKNAPQIHN